MHGNWRADLRYSTLFGVRTFAASSTTCAAAAARSKRVAARVDARGSRFSIVPLPSPPPHIHTTISTVTTVRFVPLTRPGRSASARAKYSQRKPTFIEPVIVYKRPSHNGRKLLGRNILASFFEMYSFRII